MKSLFIDTSNNMLSMAILDDGKIVIEKNYDAISEQSKYALLETAQMFEEGHIEPKDIDKLFVVNGPGSFTGVRIGVTIMKTFAWSLNIPVIPISSLKACALSYSDKDYYITIIDARRDHVYAGIYDKDYNNIIDETYISTVKINNVIDDLKGSIGLIGNINITNKYPTEPIKLDIAKIVAYYKNCTPINVHELKPNYLKKVEAEEKLTGVFE
jgi:tRNA threonylcarbamoyladenosine biosynthesis protein TsaB